MLKLMGALCLIAGGAGLGRTACARLRERAGALRAMADGLELMERELTFSLPPMPELLEGLAGRTKPPASAFFAQCAQGLDELPARTWCEIWQEAAARHLGALSRADLEVLLPLGGVLGRYSGEDQRQAVTQTVRELRGCLESALEERRRQGRVYGALGVTAGAFLVILLL